MNDAVVTLYVHAGIAASDVICCARLGQHSTGENHAEAIGLLKAADSGSSGHLAALLSMKTKAGYSHLGASAADVRKAARAAARLLESARGRTKLTGVTCASGPRGPSRRG
ncbi:hypothetical protein [Jiangella muralis]|uniref:hypothetical protein n=1 Tax=Jiangella muralis TaxID=702383 RepID=UPI000AE359DD|nr:hypothetical protein [Jiangella muralis]